MRAHLIALLAFLAFTSAHDFETFEEEECGRIPQVSHPLVLRGEPALPGEIPWAALLLRGGSLCSGTLITNQHVLTAAHCYLDEKWSSSFTGYLRVGFDSSCTIYPCKRMKMHRIENIYFPRNAEGSTPTDIAIVQLDKPVMEKGVWPICLPSEQDHICSEEIVHVAGWGLDPNHPGTRLNKLHYSWKQVSEKYGMYIIRGDRHAVCAGDSGVGLYHVKEAQATVFGLLSAGKNCTKVQKEGHSEDTFVPVTNMLWWIRSILDGKVTDETIHFAYDAKKELYRRQEPMYYK